MRVIVTGAAGFIGSHLCDRLLEVYPEAEVIGIDVRPDTWRLSSALQSSRFSLITADVRDISSLQSDVVFHAAAIVGVKRALVGGKQVLTSNLEATQAVLRATPKNTRFVYFSSSELYGSGTQMRETDSIILNPITDFRWGYDYEKAVGEALTLATKENACVARLFNSIPGDEWVVAIKDGILVHSPVNQIEVAANYTVPTLSSSWTATAASGTLIKVETDWKQLLKIKTKFGRTITVTPAHSVFIEGPNGLPIETAAINVKIGDRLAVCKYVEIPEKQINSINVLQLLSDTESVVEGCDRSQIEEQRSEIFRLFRDQISYIDSKVAHWKSGRHGIPTHVYLRIPGLKGRTVRCLHGSTKLPLTISLDSHALWALGFFLGEGRMHKSTKGFQVALSSETYRIEKFIAWLNTLGVPASIRWRTGDYVWPEVCLDDKTLFTFFDKLGFAHRRKDRRIPPWIMQLPLPQLACLLRGYRDADGTHEAAWAKNPGTLVFNTKSEGLARDLLLCLARFGLIGQIGKYQTWHQRQKHKKHSFWRITLNGLPNADIETWDRNITQTVQSHTLNDVVFASVKQITEIEAPKYVYDFSVPGTEKFIAGGLVVAHNTCGPRQDINTGAVLPTFVRAAIEGKAIRVLGDGSQRRCFTHVADTVNGLILVAAEGNCNEIYNIGSSICNLSVLELAQLVWATLRSDDPKIIFDPSNYPSVGCAHRVPDSTKLQNLNWKTTKSIADAINGIANEITVK